MPFRLPAAGGPGQGDQLGSGQQIAGQGHDLAPDLVLREPFQGGSAPGVLGVPDPVPAPGPPPVPWLRVGELAAPGVGGEGGEAVPVDVGEPQPCAGIWAPSGR